MPSISDQRQTRAADENFRWREAPLVEPRRGKYLYLRPCTAQVQTECGVLQSPRPRPMYVASIVCCIVWARLQRRRLLGRLPLLSSAAQGHQSSPRISAAPSHTVYSLSMNPWPLPSLEFMLKKARQPRGSRALIAATNQVRGPPAAPPRRTPLLLLGTVTCTGLLQDALPHSQWRFTDFTDATSTDQRRQINVVFGRPKSLLSQLRVTWRISTTQRI